MPVVIDGNNTPTAGGIGYGDGSELAFTSAGSSGQVLTSAGSGTPTWSTVSSDPGLHRVVVATGNGFGSSSTAIRRFQTVVTNTGASITYADSATLGATFTINTTGVYSVSYTDMSGGASAYWGVTLNETSLTTSIQDLGAVSSRLVMTSTNAASVRPNCSITLRLSSGDVIRAQGQIGALQSNNADVQFSINRVS